MVAYSFQKRFAPLIVAGTKTQTIRAARPRHVRPGESIQLYTGMRSTTCLKIMPDPLCVAVEPVCLRFDQEQLIEAVEIDGAGVEDIDGFALRDGFESAEDMAAFWTKAHGHLRQFSGVLIRWVPVSTSGRA